MIVFPHAKINLGLQILDRRVDGFHNLETIFYPVQWNDALELIPEPESDHIHFSSSGLVIDAPAADNLCVRAYQLIKTDFPRLRGIRCWLHKTIPSGAGLGGGSSDAAFMLKAIRQLALPTLSDEALHAYALQLGSDVPYFLLNTPAVATGRGEKLTPCAIDLSAYHIIIVHPGIHVHTGRAFSALSPNRPYTPVSAALDKPVHTWKDYLFNHFEESVFNTHPEIAAIKQQLYDAGALYASLSGSGSSVYGLFEQKPEKLIFPPHYAVHNG
jgi:4-diphosphocytidyl-2-C-methyl-D-erythritol kinase